MSLRFMGTNRDHDGRQGAKKRVKAASSEYSTTAESCEAVILSSSPTVDEEEIEQLNKPTFENENHECRDHHGDHHHHHNDDSTPSKHRKSSDHHHHHHHQSKRKKRREEKKSRRRRHRGDSSKDRLRRYVYSAISSTFLFVMLRELGWIDQMYEMIQSNQVPTTPASILRRIRGQKDDSSSSKVLGGAATEGLASAAANMAATSMTLKHSNSDTDRLVTTKEASQSQTLQSSTSYLTRSEMMDFVTQTDSTITAGSRPIMYTFFEWIPPRNRGTQMSDLADKALIAEWKAAWKAAGWQPKVLTMEDAKKHEKYQDYAPKLNKIPMLGVDGMGGNVIYNQLCFFRWLAMAQVGGGFMSDYDVFPVSRAPETNDPPFKGDFTVYCKIKRSEKAGIPCLMSGRSDEWTRMAYALLDNGIKNSETETMWSDMLALIDMRNDNAYQIHNSVLEGQDVLLKHGWNTGDCNITLHKKAIHFSHEALRLGYINPGETAEDRPDIIRRFLQNWHQECGDQEEAMA